MIVNRLQTLLPQHTLSQFIGWLCRQTKPQFMKNMALRTFIRHYGIDMREYQRKNPHDYQNFNDFFTRELAPEARSLNAAPDTIISPIDGFVSASGTITAGNIFQAKQHNYTLLELLAGAKTMTQTFLNGHFATLYLAPKNYHRVHMPFTGKLIGMTYVPGRLFSVSTKSVATIPRLFARNERIICQFDTMLGPMAVIMVGAMLVGSMQTTWAGVIKPHQTKIQYWDYHDQNITLEKGKEMGRFLMGSTVILLFPHNTIQWSETLSAHTPLLLGQQIGHKNNG